MIDTPCQDMDKKFDKAAWYSIGKQLSLRLFFLWRATLTPNRLPGFCRLIVCEKLVNRCFFHNLLKCDRYRQMSKTAPNKTKRRLHRPFREKQALFC